MSTGSASGLDRCATGGLLAGGDPLVQARSPARRRCRSEGDGVPVFWQNLGTYDPAVWIPIAAVATQIVVATVVTILALRWQERTVLGVGARPWNTSGAAGSADRRPLEAANERGAV